MQPSNTEVTHSAPRAWSITKAEWDGYQRSPTGKRWVTWLGIGMTLLLAVVMGLGPYLAMRAFGIKVGGMGFLVVACLLTTIAIVQVIWAIRWQRQWDRMRPLVWDSHGCVCPWCRVRVDETECPGHGFTRDDQPKLVAYWESLPKYAHTDRLRAVEALMADARRRPLSWTALEPIRRLARASMKSQFDASLTPWQRVRASLPWTMVKLAAGVCVLVVAFKLLPRQYLAGVLTGCWPALLVGPVFLLIGPLWRVGKLRCTACKHLCASEQPTLCTECGADLTKPAAVARHEMLPQKWIALALVPMLLFGLAPFFQDAIVGVLPTTVQHAIWRNLRPPNRYWEGLNPATMTQAEVDEASRLLIDCAAPGGGRPLFDFSFFDSLQKAGKLTPAILEQAARSVVQATLEVDSADGRVTAIVRPSFGELVLPSAMTPRLVFGGVSVDDGPWSAPAAWSLFLHDIEEFWRANGQLKALPEDQLVFRTELDALSPGPHTVRARCWIVLYQWPWARYVPAFSDTGELQAPQGSTVYALPLEASVQLP